MKDKKTSHITSWQGLKETQTPPQTLENQVVNQLISQGLVKPRTTSRLLRTWGISIAASIIFFVAGYYVHAFSSTSARNYLADFNYMLLLHEDSQFITGDPQQRFQEYAQWMGGIYEKGMQIDGQELARKAHNVQTQASKKSYTTGYFLLKAATLQQAKEVAQSCPHVKYGGDIEIKPILKQ